MKRFHMAGGLLGALAVLGLMGSTALAKAPPTRSLVPHAGATINISFDGFCDGMALTLSGVDDVGLNAVPTGCTAGQYTEFGFGASSLTPHGNTFFVVTPGTGIGLFYVIQAGKHQAWADYYDAGGGVITLYASGTYSLGLPAEAPTHGRSTVPQAEAFVSRPEPQSAIAIDFSDFCDGMQLNTTAPVVRPSLQHVSAMDGFQTGCAADPLIGFRTAQGWYGDSVGGVYDSAGPNSPNLLWRLSLDCSFVIYGQNPNGKERIIRTGNWTGNQLPGVPQRGLFPSSRSRGC